MPASIPVSRLFLLVSFLLALAGCASNKPFVDYDSGFDFSGISTYSLLPRVGDSPPEITDRRIADAIRAQLNSRDWYELSAGQAQVQIRFSQYLQARENNQRVTIGLGTGNYGRSGGISVGGSVNVPVGDEVLNYQFIQIEFISDKGVIWRGNHSLKVNTDDPQGMQQAQLQLVNIILSQFPPPVSK